MGPDPLYSSLCWSQLSHLMEKACELPEPGGPCPEVADRGGPGGKASLPARSHTALSRCHKSPQWLVNAQCGRATLGLLAALVKDWNSFRAHT